VIGDYMDFIGKKILWVEDDYYRLKYLLDPLKERGIEVIPARSYIEACSLIENSNFDLIILDLIIPYSENETEEPKDSNPRRDGDEYTLDKLIRNGIRFFNHVIDDLEIDIPIIVLSIVKNKTILDELGNKKKIKKLDKIGRMPEDVERVVLQCLRESGRNESNTQ
jgi:CheY-like chemotaxis protein